MVEEKKIERAKGDANVPWCKHSGAAVHAQGGNGITMAEREWLFKPSRLSFVRVFYLDFFVVVRRVC